MSDMESLSSSVLWAERVPTALLSYTFFLAREGRYADGVWIKSMAGIENVEPYKKPKRLDSIRQSMTLEWDKMSCERLLSSSLPTQIGKKSNTWVVFSF